MFLYHSLVEWSNASAVKTNMSKKSDNIQTENIFEDQLKGRRWATSFRCPVGYCNTSNYWDVFNIAQDNENG